MLFRNYVIKREILYSDLVVTSYVVNANAPFQFNHNKNYARVFFSKRQVLKFMKKHKLIDTDKIKYSIISIF